MLVLDANILIRAVLGSRVLSLLRKYTDRVEFLSPDTAFQEAREWLPEIMDRRQLPAAPTLEALDLIAVLERRIECEIYSQHEAVARQRIDKRDEDDWPVLGACLRLPDLDRGYGLLRLRRRDLDYGSGGIVFGGGTGTRE